MSTSTATQIIFDREFRWKWFFGGVESRLPAFCTASKEFRAYPTGKGMGGRRPLISKGYVRPVKTWRRGISGSNSARKRTTTKVSWAATRACILVEIVRDSNRWAGEP